MGLRHPVRGYTKSNFSKHARLWHDSGTRRENKVQQGEIGIRQENEAI